MMDKQKNITFQDQLINIVDEKTTPLDYVQRIISDYKSSKKDDPFYVMNISQVLRKHQEWCREMPRVKPYYSVKCNPDSIILATLARLGCGFDCASVREIESVMDLGVHPDRIIYAHPCKAASYIRVAKERQVKLMTFDSEDEMIKIQELYPEAELVLRIAEHDKTALDDLSKKFGCHHKGVAPTLLKKAAERGIKIVGISFHVGTGCKDPEIYEKSIRNCRTLFDIGNECGHRMRLLDIGGGFPGHDGEFPFLEMTVVINKSLDEHFPIDGGVEVIGEPGRFYASFAYTLCLNIIARSEVEANKITKDFSKGQGQEKGYLYYVNDGTYGSFHCPKMDKLIKKPLIFKKSTEPEYWSVVWGPTCCNTDCLLEKERFPKLDQGDWMVFDNMGAYTLSASSEFNGFPRPKIYHIITDKDSAFLTNMDDLHGKYG